MTNYEQELMKSELRMVHQHLEDDMRMKYRRMEDECHSKMNKRTTLSDPEIGLGTTLVCIAIMVVGFVVCVLKLAPYIF